MYKRKFSSAFKVKVALEAIRGQKTLRELSQQYSLHPQQISLWKQQALDNMQASFLKKKRPAPGCNELHTFPKTRPGG